jgi:hypothetical protein
MEVFIVVAWNVQNPRKIITVKSTFDAALEVVKSLPGTWQSYDKNTDVLWRYRNQKFDVAEVQKWQVEYGSP